MALLEITDLKKHFRLNPGFLARVMGGKQAGLIKAVDGVSFCIEAGEILGLAGESGCGKSTTGLTVAALIPPTAGQIRFKGGDVTNLKGSALQDYRKQVQIIFQDPYESLNPRFTVFNAVAEPLRALKMGSREEVRQKVMEMLGFCGLNPGEYKDRYPHQMSGGERQRVGLASALVPQPELVIGDEPLSMLDVSIRAGILDLIRDLSARMNFSCLYISHDLSILSNIADRLMIMYLGRIAEVAPTRKIVENPLHPYTRALISAVAIPDPSHRRPIPDIRGEVSRPVNPPPGCRFQGRCPRVKSICKDQSPVLKEVSTEHFVACHLWN